MRTTTAVKSASRCEWCDRVVKNMKPLFRFCDVQCHSSYWAIRGGLNEAQKHYMDVVATKFRLENQGIKGTGMDRYITKKEAEESLAEQEKHLRPLKSSWKNPIR